MADHTSLLLVLLVLAGLSGGGCTGPEALPGAPVRTAVSVLENVRSEVWQEGELAGALHAERIEMVPASGSVDMTKVEVVAKDAGALAFLVSEGEKSRFGIDGAGEEEKSGLAAEDGGGREADGKNGVGGAAEPGTVPDREPLERLEISAEHFRGRGKAGIGVFEGRVSLAWGRLRMRCARLEVVYDGDLTEVLRIIATGEVGVELGDRRCSAGKATFEPRGRILVLEDKPVLHEGGDEIEGRKITVDLAQEQIECEDCRVRWSPKSGGKGSLQ